MDNADRIFLVVVVVSFLLISIGLSHQIKNQCGPAVPTVKTRVAV